jgi:uncharacterized protein (DUF433 family)
MEHTRITREAAVLGGKPCVQGTRVAVEHILEKFASGYSEAEVLAAYPFLSVEDVRAALAYASDYLARDGVLAA